MVFTRLVLPHQILLLLGLTRLVISHSSLQKHWVQHRYCLARLCCHTAAYRNTGYRFCFHWALQDWWFFIPTYRRTDTDIAVTGLQIVQDWCCLIPAYRSSGTDVAFICQYSIAVSFQLTEVLAQILLLLVCTKLLSDSNLHFFTEVLAQIFSFIGLYNYKIAILLQFTEVLVQILVCTRLLSHSNLQMYWHKYFLYWSVQDCCLIPTYRSTGTDIAFIGLFCTTVQDCCLIPTYRSTGTDIFTGLYKVAVLFQLKEVLVQILLLLVCTRKIAVSFHLKKYWYRYCL